MKTPPLTQKSLPEVERAAPSSGVAMVNKVIERRPEISPAIDWLRANGFRPGAVISAALDQLSKRGRHLPKDQRLAYAETVLLGEFLARWSKKHHGTSVKELQENEHTNQNEIRPFVLALMAIGTERAFKKTLPRLARIKEVAGMGGDLGSPNDYSCFVMNHSGVLAHRFLANFDPNVRNPAAKAVKYLVLTSVSHYLNKGVHAERDDAGLSRHLRRSTRLGTRTKLAAKLVYFPTLLTDEDRAYLRKRFKLKGTLVKRMRVKDVAAMMGYPTPNTLSRKLYRVRGWVASQKQQQEEGPQGEVQY